MLDPFTYRSNEVLAKKDPALELRARAHVVEHFENIGFPVRINSIQEVGPILNTMQENRFNLYMQEMGGLTELEFDMFINACRRHMDFQRKFLPFRRVMAPLSV